jgi:aryl-phospho-beta-D-glucosidase BglC (GH1 family)
MYENKGAPDNPPWDAATIAAALAGGCTETHGIQKAGLYNLLDSEGKSSAGIQMGFGSARGQMPTDFDHDDAVANSIFDDSLDYARTEWDFSTLASMGFDLVRLAINWRDFVSSWSPFTYRNVAKLDTVLNWADTHGINVILNAAKAPLGCNTSPKSGNDGKNEYWVNATAQSEFQAFWGEIADRYKAQGNIVGYDLMNEPEAPDKVTFVTEMAALKSAIRAKDPTAVIFFEGNRWTIDLDWVHSSLLDSNTKLSIHFYWPGIYAVHGRGNYLG